MKWFEIKFKGNDQIFYIKANSFQEALTLLGYSDKVMFAVQYYNEVNEIPLEYKEIHIIDETEDDPDLKITTSSVNIVQFKFKVLTSILLHAQDPIQKITIHINNYEYTVLAKIHPTTIEFICMNKVEENN